MYSLDELDGRRPGELVIDVHSLLYHWISNV